MQIKKDTLATTLQYPQALFEELVEGSSRLRRIQFNRMFENVRNVRMPRINKKNIFKYILPIVLVLLAVFIVRQALSPKPSTGNTIIGVSDTKPLSSTAISREFKFPLRDGKGKEVGKLSYTIKEAELRKQIIVKGKRATAVAGRIFLIINLKIVNDLNQGLEVNSRDYIRITVNRNTKELFAPDIHNDPVEVQAISTKNTRVGLAINETDKNIELRVGEINGAKETIKLNF